MIYGRIGGHTMVAITTEELLVIAPNIKPVDRFYMIQTDKYKVKRLGRYRELLG